MIVRGTTRVRCPACGTETDCALVQTIHTRDNPDDKARLLAGELNVLACACGKRTPLGAHVLYSDPDRALFVQVCPGGEDAVAAGAAAFAASGVTGTLRVVPSQNALVEKVKIADAGLADWAIEMMKVLVLSSAASPGSAGARSDAQRRGGSIGELDRVLLFDSADGELIHWILFDEDFQAERVSSARAGYDRLAVRAPPEGELRIDRAWAVAAVQRML
ncbi:MAG: CpXC domain-containing protein, partial [Acidobacteriota bacterium]